MSHQDDKPVVVIERSDGGLGSFLIGLAIGAATALLFAPRSGEDTRRELRNQGRRLRATASEKAEELQELLGGGYEETRHRIEEGLEKAKDTYEDKKSDAKEAVQAGKAAVSSAREELERRLATRKARGRAAATADAEADD